MNLVIFNSSILKKKLPCVCVRSTAFQYSCALTVESKDSLQEAALSFHHVNPIIITQVVGLGDDSLYPLAHLACLPPACFFLSLKVYLFYFMCMWVPAWMSCPTYVSGAYRGQTRVSSPLELDLQVTVSCQVSAGDQSCVLCKSSKCATVCGMGIAILTGWLRLLKL